MIYRLRALYEKHKNARPDAGVRRGSGDPPHLCWEAVGEGDIVIKNRYAIAALPSFCEKYVALGLDIFGESLKKAHVSLVCER